MRTFYFHRATFSRSPWTARRRPPSRRLQGELAQSLVVRYHGILQLLRGIGRHRICVGTIVSRSRGKWQWQLGKALKQAVAMTSLPVMNQP